MALTFLSLWAFDRVQATSTCPTSWLASRSPPASPIHAPAGLPLLAAAGVWLVLNRYRAAALAVGVGGPALLVDARRTGRAYVSEF
jgi:hypothetical protein